MKRKKSPDSKAKHTKKSKKSNPSNGIDKSQRLLRSMQTPTKGKRASDKTDKRNGVGIVCGKPMPPLSELEKMYEGSDEEIPETTAVAASVDIKAPEENSNGAITPTTAKKYADEILKILNDQDAPQPIIPMKKYKKPEVPYIVGCTERERIPENPNCNVFKGDDYGITKKTNAFNEDQCCADTPGFYMNGYSLSKSIFNAQANEIASKLLSNENNPFVGSSDSEDTMIYELNSPKGRFSPVPSTSKDNETISKNDQRFIESFVSPKKNYGETDHAIETFSKTIVTEGDLFNKGADLKNPSYINLNPESSPQEKIVHELVTNNFSSSLNSGSYDDIEIIEQPCETIEINDEMDVKTKSCTYVKSEDNRNNKSDMVVDNIILDNDDICEIIDTNTTKANIKSKDKAQAETNRHNSLRVLQKYDNPSDRDIIVEIDLTDVDDVISENQSIIDKYSKYNIVSSVNLVETNVAKSKSVENTKTLNMQFGSKNNQTNTVQTTNDRHLSNKLENIVKEFFDKRGNASQPLNRARPRFLLRHEIFFPKCSLNNSLTHRIFPEHSPNTNKQNKRKRKNESQNKADNNINSSTTNLCNVNNNVETPCQPSLGTCPICLDDLTRERVGSTNCGHLFCMDCLSTALKTKPKRCPTCRKKLTGLGYHQIFL